MISESMSVAEVEAIMATSPHGSLKQYAGFENVRQAFNSMWRKSTAVEALPPQPQYQHPTGIVICAGGWKFFASLYVTIKMIRESGCTLPIQVWFLGDRGEFDIRMLQALSQYDVGWICANSYVREKSIPVRIVAGWEMKPLAAMYAPFETVILLDADSYPAYNPENFLQSEEFKKVGACFWPDQGDLEAGQWDRFGVPRHDEAAWESGQFVVDKSRHWRPLYAAHFMNQFSDYVYEHIYGDKDTFHLAWRMCGHATCIPTRYPGWDTIAFIQKDFAGNPLFIHRTRDKFRWVYGDIDGSNVPANYMTVQWHQSVQFVSSLPKEHLGHQYVVESDQLLRAHLHFKFIDGTHGWCRDIWDTVNLRNEYGLRWNHFKPNDVVLDIGANVGAFALAAHRSGSRKIVCVEPLEVNRHYMSFNLECIFGSWSCIPKAVWDSDAGIAISEDTCHVPGNTSTATAFTEHWVEKPEVALIPSASLDQIIDEALEITKEQRIRYIKIDAEGAEYPALLSATKLHLVDEIVGESHENVNWGGICPGVNAVQAVLVAAGFEVTAHQNGPSTFIFRGIRRA